MVKYKRESDMHVYNVLVTALVVGVLSSTASSHHQILQPKHIKKNTISQIWLVYILQTPDSRMRGKQ